MARNKENQWKVMGGWLADEIAFLKDDCVDALGRPFRGLRYSFESAVDNIGRRISDIKMNMEIALDATRDGISSLGSAFQRNATEADRKVTIFTPEDLGIKPQAHQSKPDYSDIEDAVIIDPEVRALPAPRR